MLDPKEQSTQIQDHLHELSTALEGGAFVRVRRMLNAYRPRP